MHCSKEGGALRAGEAGGCAFNSCRESTLDIPGNAGRTLDEVDMRLRPFPASNSADKLHNTKIICAMAGPSMFVMIEALERPERKLQQWQLRLLCFAVTRDPDDRAAAFSFAAELDALGRDGYRGFSFFFRTSREVCDAILASGHQRSEATLRRHASRIEDPQLEARFSLCRRTSRDSTAAAATVQRRSPYRLGIFPGAPPRSSSGGPIARL
jgi:hypothetical protein